MRTNLRKVKGIELTDSEHRVLKKMSQGVAINTAVKDVYKSVDDHAASITATRLLKRDRFIAVLERAGLTDAKLAEKFTKLLDHKKPVVVGKEVQMFDDGTVQLSTLKTLTKVKGYMDDEDEAKALGEPLVIKSIHFEDNRMVVNTPNAQKKDS